MSEKQVTSDPAKKDACDDSSSVEPSIPADDDANNLSTLDKLVTKLEKLTTREKKKGMS